MDWLGPRIAVVVLALVVINFLTWNMSSYLLGLPLAVAFMWLLIFISLIIGIVFVRIKENHNR